MEKVKKVRQRIFDEEGMKALAEQTKKYRIERGYSQEQLGFDSGIGERQVVRIENAQANPTLSTVIAIVRTLESSLPEFLNFPISKGVYLENLIEGLGNNEAAQEINRLKAEVVKLKQEIKRLTALKTKSNKKK